MDGYLGISAHGVVSDSFEPFHAFLAIPVMRGMHTDKAIFDANKSVMKEYNLVEKVRLITFISVWNNSKSDDFSNVSMILI